VGRPPVLQGFDAGQPIVYISTDAGQPLTSVLANLVPNSQFRPR